MEHSAIQHLKNTYEEVKDKLSVEDEQLCRRTIYMLEKERIKDSVALDIYRILVQYKYSNK